MHNLLTVLLEKKNINLFLVFSFLLFSFYILDHHHISPRVDLISFLLLPFSQRDQSDLISPSIVSSIRITPLSVHHINTLSRWHKSSCHRKLNQGSHNAQKVMLYMHFFLIVENDRWTFDFLNLNFFINIFVYLSCSCVW